MHCMLLLFSFEGNNNNNKNDVIIIRAIIHDDDDDDDLNVTPKLWRFLLSVFFCLFQIYDDHKCSRQVHVIVIFRRRFFYRPFFLFKTINQKKIRLFIYNTIWHTHTYLQSKSKKKEKIFFLFVPPIPLHGYLCIHTHNTTAATKTKKTWSFCHSVLVWFCFTYPKELYGNKNFFFLNNLCKKFINVWWKKNKTKQVQQTII